MHHNIKGYFAQFKHGNDFTNIRKKLQRYGSISGDAFLNNRNGGSDIKMSDQHTVTSRDRVWLLCVLMLA